jgi:hypothetical protein
LGLGHGDEELTNRSDLDGTGWDGMGLDWIGSCTLAFWNGSPLVYAPAAGPCPFGSATLRLFMSVHMCVVITFS